MSYDISLYQREFLARALTEGLGDWTNADPIPSAARDAVVALAEAAGFVREAHAPAFVAFAQTQGFEPSDRLVLDSQTVLAELSLHDGQIAFTIPFSDRATASIELCAQIAKQAAREHGLGYHDP